MKRVNKTDNRGFTLSELMVVTIIIALIVTTIGAGIPSVVKAFRTITRTANAQTIMSTAVNEIKGDLRYARTDELVAKNKAGQPVFYNTDGYLMTYKNASDGSGIYRVYYKGTDKVSEDSDKVYTPNETAAEWQSRTGSTSSTMPYEAQPLLTEREQANGVGQSDKLQTTISDFKYDNGVYQLTLIVTGSTEGEKTEQTITVRALNE